MDEFPGNSRFGGKTAKDEERGEPKKVQRVVTSDVRQQKPSLGKRFFKTFAGGETNGVLNYITQDVLIPAFREAISDAASGGVERLLFGEDRSRVRRSRMGPAAHTPYNRYSQVSSAPARSEPRNMSRRGRAMHDFNEIIIGTRVEAEEVLASMDDLLRRYELVTVEDLYNLVGIPATYTDNRWGWIDLSDASIIRQRTGGYLLNLPSPEPIPNT